MLQFGDLEGVSAMSSSTSRSPAKATEIRLRVEPELKERAAEILAAHDLNLADAIRIFLHRVIASQGLPFELKVPSGATRASLEEARLITRMRLEDDEGWVDDRGSGF
jgi:DNA-damage-inducible protein J